jgi:hypothetical protein
MTRKIFPVSGSRSTLASVGSMVLGIAFEMASLLVVEDLDSPPACSFSTPPVVELRREVRPSRL